MRSVAVLVSGTVAGQAISIAASPLITRLYSPEDYGVLAVLAAVLSILLVIASFRFEVAIPVPSRDSVAMQLLVLSLGTVLLVSFLTAVVISIWGGTISLALGLPEGQAYLWYVPATLVAAGVYNALKYWSIRTKEFGRIARTRVVQGAGGVSTQIGLGLLTTGPLGLLAGAAVGQAMGVGSLAAAPWRRRTTTSSRLNVRALAATASKWRRFPILSGPAALLNNAGVQITPILLAVMYGGQIVGWFSLGQRVIGLPVAILGQALGQVFFSRAATIARENPRELARLFSRLATTLLVVSVIIVPMIAVSAPSVFALVFGSEWRESGRYVQVLAPMIGAQLIVSPLSQTIFILGRQDLQLVWDVGRFALSLSVFGVAYVGGLDAFTTIAAYGFVMFACYLVAFFMYWYTVRKHTDSNAT